MKKNTLKVFKFIKKNRNTNLIVKLYPTNDLMDSQYFINIKKVRCIPITYNNQICLVSHRRYFNWTVPGGTIEKGENAITTLKRELKEEANLEIQDYELIGFLEIIKMNNLNKLTKKHTEIWFIAKVSKILKQIKDPSTGYALYRNFFRPTTFVNQLQNWGEISNYFLKKIQNKIST